MGHENGIKIKMFEMFESNIRINLFNRFKTNSYIVVGDDTVTTKSSRHF